MKDCKTYCGKEVPYIVYESAQAKSERIFKRMWIANIILILALIISNVAWICYESQFETVSYEQEVTQKTSGSGSNNFVGGNVNGGRANGKDEDNDESEEVKP